MRAIVALSLAAVHLSEGVVMPFRATAAPQRSLRRSCKLAMLADSEDAERTAQKMAPLWKAAKRDGGVSLIPASPGWKLQTLEVNIARSEESPGIGLMLEEFGSEAGGKVGLTLVSGLVEGGNAANAPVQLLPGDVIVAAGGVSTEALNYDLTVEALAGMPPAPSPARITVKRLVKLPSVRCTVMYPPDEGRPDREITLFPGQYPNFRIALIMNGFEVGPCNEDLQCCKDCGMLVRKGRALLNEPGTQERQMLAKEPFWRLTCRACVAPIEQDEEMVIRIRPDLDNIMAWDPTKWRT